MASVEKMLQRFSAVVVTGGSSGIGKSFIEHIGKLHPDVRICNLSRRSPEQELLQLNVRHVACDLSDPASTTAGIAEVLGFLNNDVPAGSVLLINNSGFGAYGHFPEPSADRLRAMIEVNVAAVVALTSAVLPVMRSRGGAIMTVASTAAFQPTAYLATYGATKAFVLHWSLALNEELRGSGVQALAVCPGPTATAFFSQAGLGEEVPGGMGQTSDAVVEEALCALASGRSQVITGWRNWLMANASSILPRPLSAWIAARILARYRLKRP
ncbi:SDR family oxidoreductase [Opitutaceae bacterium]